MIKAENLCFTYEQEEVDYAISGVGIEIKKGEFVAILGHNGSGKSTLARHINALLIPTEGTLWVNDSDTKDEKNTWLIRQSVGMVFQNPDNQIIATMVEEDVAFGPENLGVEPTEIRKRVDDSLEVVRMSDFKRTAPHLLSGGQKQRVAIAGVLAMQPACIVLDEPTAMLDPSGRREVLETIEKLNHDSGITVVLITHFMEEAARAKRVIVMDEGRVVLDSPPREIFKNAKQMQELGLAVPTVTQLAHNLREMGIPVRDDLLTAEELASDPALLELITIKDKK